MKTLILALTLLPLSSFCFGQITLEECQEKARLNYPLIKQYDLISKSSEYTVSNANKAYLPQFSVTGIEAWLISGLPSAPSSGGGSSDQDKLKFIGIGQLSQTIWDGGVTGAQKDISRASAEIDKASTDVAFQSVKERVNQTFFGILMVDEQLNQLTLLLENLDRDLSNLTLSKAQGLRYETDVDELKAEILKMDQRKIEYQYTRKGFLQMLSLLIGAPLDEGASLAIPPSAEPDSTIAVNRPELHLYAGQLGLVDAKSEVSTATYMPKIGLLGAGLLVAPGSPLGGATLSSIAFAGLSLSWNTSGIYSVSNDDELRAIQAERIKTEQRTFLFTNRLERMRVFTEIDKQKMTIRNDDEIVTLRSRIHTSYQLKYDNGMCSMNELVDAVNKEAEARSDRSLHHIQLLQSMYNYKTTSGN